MATPEADALAQWKRRCSLILADKSGDGLDFSDLRLVFSIVKGEMQTPNTATIKVYNAKPETLAKARKEFTRVLLQGGYESNFGLLFSGTVIQYRMWDENNTDKIFEIWASDGDAAYNHAVVTQSLPAGSSAKDMIMAAAKEFKAKGVGMEEMPEKLTGTLQQSLPRGQVMYGPAKNYLRSIGHDAAFSWSIQDGELRFVENAGYLKGEAVELNFATGLLGSPEQVQAGIQVRCLINPRLRIGGRIKLNNEGIVRARKDIFMGDMALPSLDRDGLYRVLKMTVTGDTRANDWHMQLTCIGLDDIMRQPLG
jgi:hypothetical protein